MADFLDKNNAKWTIVYDAPSLLQIRPWQAVSVRYSEFPHLFAFTEDGLREDVFDYAASHTPSPLKASSGPAPAEPLYVELFDKNGARWLVRHESGTSVYRAYSNAYPQFKGDDQADFKADSDAAVRAKVVTYAAAHKPQKAQVVPKPGVKNPKPGDWNYVPPVVEPANPPKGGGSSLGVALVAGLALFALTRK